MSEKINPDNYVYCERHDIFYRKELQEKAQSKNEEFRKEGCLFLVPACPICSRDMADNIVSVGGSSRKRNMSNFSGRLPNSKKFISLKRKKR